MLDKFNGENLKVGDKVIVYSIHWKTHTRYIGEVVKKTPTGLLDVKYSSKGIVDRFKPDGLPYHKTERYSTSSLYLEKYTEEQAEDIKQTRDRALMLDHLGKVDWSQYTNGELDNILRYISRLRTS